MPKPSFTGLWNSYPREQTPCNGPWANQCAIRMSLCLNTDGTITVDKKTYPEPKCAHDHARGAESLANWLWAKHLGRPRMFTSASKAKTDVAELNGIIFFKDCFTRTGESAASGDHIDLWQRGTTKTYDDPSNVSKQVWFWPLV